MDTTKKTTALVTGASRGLGYQVAKILAKKGMHIIGLARTVGALEELSDEITELQGSSTMIPINLENDEELNKLSNLLNQRWEKIDIFIHCSSVPAPMSPVTSISIKDFNRSINVNTKATLKLIQILDPFLRASNQKKAIFIDDTNSGKFLSSYSSSKAATREIIKNYREESKRIGTNVIIFTPEPMPTSLRARFYPGESKDTLSSCSVQAKELINLADL